MIKQFLRNTLVAAAFFIPSQFVSATPIVSFFIDGNTYFNSFELANDSTSGEQISKATIDFTGLGVFFDTADGGAVNDSDGRQFTPVAGTDILTGLSTPVLVADGASSFEMFFSDFGAGESIIWDIDLDFMPSPTRVDGDDLIGGLVTIEFVSGGVLTGVLSSVAGNSDASEFVTTAFSTSAISVSEPSFVAILAFGLLLVSSRKKS